MSIIIDIVNSINKFLGYLNISQKYLNKLYTILSIFPTLYIARITYGLFKNGNYLMSSLYSLLFVVLVYFIILNALYYFKDRTVKWDITQLLAKYLPNEVFIAEEGNKVQLNVAGITQPIDYKVGYELVIQTKISELVAINKIPTNNLENTDGYLIEKGTLYPYYIISKIEDSPKYEVKIGSSYEDLETIGYVEKEDLAPLGLYIVGGKFKSAGVEYKEPYYLQLKVKGEELKAEADELEDVQLTRSQLRKQKGGRNKWKNM